MPDFTSAQIHKLNRDPIADPHILLIEVEEEHSGGLVNRYAVNNEDIVSNGETYAAAVFEFAFPGHGNEQEGVSIVASNVDRKAGRALLLAQERVTVRLMVIDYADPDTVLMDTLDIFAIASAPIDAETVQVKLEPVIDWRLPVPFFRTTEDLFPGLWT